MAEQLFQIAAKALIRNNDGEILMVHIPEWSGNPEHWDLPGGRMDPNESILETLARELQEEIDIVYTETPKQLMAMLTKITIPVNNVRIPLVFIIYEVKLPAGAVISLDANGPELSYEWFTPKDAAAAMEFKFNNEFCEMVKDL